MRFATFAYDGRGRAVVTEHAGGRARHTLEYGYGSGVTRVTDARGAVSRYTFEGPGRRVPTVLERPGGEVERRVWDERRRLLRTVDARGVVTEQRFDAHHLVERSKRRFPVH